MHSGVLTQGDVAWGWVCPFETGYHRCYSRWMFRLNIQMGSAIFVGFNTRTALEASLFLRLTSQGTNMLSFMTCLNNVTLHIILGELIMIQ